MDEESKPITIECGFCLRKNLDIREPRLMPCSHVYCLMCLNLLFEVNHQVVCPMENCRKICETPIADLPLFEITEDTSRCCDVCLEKHKKTVDALMYCLDCSRKFCSSHLEQHDGLFSEHSNITVKEYLEQAIKLETRTCKQHKACPYTLGCKNCYSVVCAKCMADPSPCSKGENGSHHVLIELNKLVEILVDRDMKTKIMSKEYELETIFKKASLAQAYFDRKTSELIVSLRKRRDEQVMVITAKYSKLETELLKHRQKDRVQLTEFIDEKVLNTWTKLRNYRLKIESQAAHAHQADIIQGYQQIFAEIQRLLNEKVTRIELPRVMELSILGEKREVELKLVSSSQLIVNITDGACIKPAFAAPTNLIELPGQCNQQANKMVSLFGDLYLMSTSPSVSRITKYTIDGSSTWVDLKVTGIIDMATNNHTLFVLSSYTIYQYSSQFRQTSKFDLKQVQQTSTNYSYTSSTSDTKPSALAVVANQLIVCYFAETKIVIFTRTGGFVKFVRFSEEVMGNSKCFAMSSCGDTSMLCLSSLQPSHYEKQKEIKQKELLIKVDINTGLRVWAREEQGVTAFACFKDKYVFLAFPDKITVLDIQTGSDIGSLQIRHYSHSSRPSGFRSQQKYPVAVQCISITGDTLVVLTTSQSDYNCYCTTPYKMNFPMMRIYV